MMSTATSRFFQIPELVMKLASKLDKPTLTRFLLTNHSFNTICTPFLYAALDFSAVGSPQFSTKLVDSVESMQALARNAHHVHDLTSGPLFSAFLYNCLLAYHEQPSSNPNKIRPSLPRIDPPTETLTPLPPLAQLRSFTYSTYFALRLMRHHIFMPSSRYPRIRQAHLYWFLTQCAASLTELSLEVMFQDGDEDGEEDEGVAVLVKTLKGLGQLKKLDLCIQVADYGLWERALEALLFGGCLGERLEAVKVRSVGVVERGYDRVPLSWDQPEPDEWVEEMVEEEEEEEEEGEEVAATCKELKGSLSQLRRFDINQLEMLSMETVRSIFRACSKVQELYVPSLAKDVDIVKLAKYIVESCPCLTQLHCVSSDGDDNNDYDWSEVEQVADRDLILQIMAALPEQRLQVLECTHFRSQIWNLDEALIQRHETTLREIRLENCCSWFTSSTVRSILYNCSALEVLRVRGLRYSGTHGDGGAKVPLEDVVSSEQGGEWVCEKLVELYLNVGVETSSGRLVDEKVEGMVEWNFEEKMPLYLTEEEEEGIHERFRNLKEQVGRLERLQRVEVFVVLTGRGQSVERVLALTGLRS